MRRIAFILLASSALLAFTLGIALPYLGFGAAQAHEEQPAASSLPASSVVTINVVGPGTLNTGATGTVTVTALDGLSNPVSGVNITLTSNRPSDDVITPVSPTTDGSGQATFTISSKKVGSSTLTATNGFVSGTTSLSVITAVDAGTSTVSAPSGNLLVSTPRQITVTARDSSNNPLSNQFVEISSTPGASITPANATTNASGEAVFTFLSSTTGSFTITAQIAGIAIADNEVINVTTVGPGSTVVATPSTVLVGQNSTVTVTVIDTGGAPVVGTSVILSSSRPGNDTISGSPATTNGAGQATFTVTSNLEGASTLTAIANGIPIVSTATLTVKQVSATNSFITVSPPSVFIGQTRTVTVTVRDSSNAPLSGATVTLSSDRGPGDTISPSSATTDINGIATFSVSSLNPGTANLTAVANGITITPSAAIQFTTISPTLSSVTPTAIAAIKGVPVNITVNVRDTANVAVANAQVTITSTPSLPSGSTISPSIAIANGSGTASFTVTSSGIGNFTLSFVAQFGSNSQPLSATLSLAVREISNTLSSITPVPSTVAVNAPSVVTVTVKDTDGNPVDGATVTLTGASSITPSSAVTGPTGTATFTVSHNTYGVITLQATATKGTSSATFSTSLNVTGVSPTLSTASPSPLQTVVNVPKLLTVTVRDTLGNLLSGVPVTFPSLPTGVTVLPASKNTNPSGVADFQVSANAAGSYLLGVQAGSTLLTPNVTLLVTQVSNTLSTVSPTSASFLVGSPTGATITVTVRDTSNQLVEGVPVSLSSSPGGPSFSPLAMFSNTNGEATFTVTSSTPGTFTLSATANTITLSQTVALEVIGISAGNSTVAVSPAAVFIGMPATVTVTVKDTNNNSVPAGIPVTLNSSPSAGVTITPASTTTNSSGVATFTVTSANAGTLTLTATAGTTPLTPATLTVNGVNSTANFTLSPTTVFKNAPATITVAVVDTSSNPVPAGVNVTLNAPTGVTVSPVTATTGPGGVATFSVSSAIVNTYSAFSATVGSTTITPTTPISLSVIGVSGTNSTVTIAPTSVFIGAPATVTVTVRDTANNLVPAGVPVTLTSIPAAGVTISGSGTTNASGVATFTVISANPGTLSLTAIADGVTITPSVSLTVNGISNTANFTLSPTSVFKNVNATVTVAVVDTSSNPVPAGVNVTLNAPSGVTVSPSTAPTNSSGVATFNVSSANIGTYNAFTATVGSTTITPTTPISLSVIGVSGTNSTVAVSPSATFVGGNATVSVSVRDTNNALVPAGVPVSLSATPGSISISPATANTDSSGVATFTVSSTTPGTYTLTATADGVSVTNSATLTVNGISATLSTVAASPMTIVTGSSSTVSVTVRDTGNNLVSGATVVLTSDRGSADTISPSSATTNVSGVATFTITSSTLGTATLSATANGVPISNTGTLNVVSGPDLALTKTSLGTFTVNTNSTFNLTVTNLGGPIASSGTVITVTDNLPPGVNFVSASGPSFTCTASGTTVSCTRTSGMNASESATITLVVLPTASGLITNTANVTLTGATDTNPTNNAASVSTTVQPPTPQTISNTLSTMTLSTTSAPANGTTPIGVLVNVRNTTNQPVSGAQVTLQATPNTGLSILSAPTLNSDANGQVAFEVRSTVAQTVTLTVSISSANNVTLPSQTVTFTASGAPTPTPGAGGTISEANSTVVSNYNSIPADNQTAATVTVTLRDANNQPVAGKQVTLRANPALASVSIQPPSGTSDANGVVSFSVRASAQGQATFSAEAFDGRVFFITQTATIQFTAPGTQPVANPAAPGTQTGTQVAAARPGQGTLTVPIGPLSGRVVAWRLRVRQGPGLSFPILGLLAYNTTVSIVARDARSTWYQIDLENGEKGWVSARWLRVSRNVVSQLPVVAAPGTSPIILLPAGITAQQNEGVGVVNTFLLRVRVGPGTQFRQIGLLSEGTEIVIIGVSRDRRWYLFRTAEGTAWTSALYVKLKFVNGPELPLLNPDGTPLF